MVKLKFPNINIDFLMVGLLLIAIGVNWWLSKKGIDAGNTYWGLLIGVVIIMVMFLIIIIFSPENDSKEMKSIFKIPFNTTLKVSSLFFIIGIVGALLFALLISTATSFSIPLFSNDINQGFVQSFSQAELQENTIWKIIVYVFDAGTIEEIVFSWGVPMASFILIWLLVKFLLEGKAPLGIKNHTFILIIAILLATISFSAVHVLNSNYDTTKEYLIAGVFKLVSLVTIFYLGIPLSHWVGYHMMNNFIWLVQQEGGTAIAKGIFTSVGGWSILIFLLLILYYVARNWSETWDEVKEHFRGIFSRGTVD